MKSMISVFALSVLLAGSVSGQEDGGPELLPGGLTEETLGENLKAIGLKPVKNDQRYDFAFKTSIRGKEWKFSMSSVLSRNGQSLWVMAWLDKIPAKAADVPRTNLLRLLAANDRMGKGKFFAYIPSNKRFVIQRVVPNKELTPAKITQVMQDLAISVADEYPIWSVANWAPAPQAQPANSSAVAERVPVPTNANQVPTVQTSEAASKYSVRRVQ